MVTLSNENNISRGHVMSDDGGSSSMSIGTFSKTIYFPVVGLLGLIGNVISFIAFKQKFKQYKTFLSLMILIACDCISILVFWQLGFSDEFIAKMPDKSIYFWAWFQAYIPITCIGLVNTLSAFLMVLIMFQRIYSIKTAVEFSNENHVRKIWMTFFIGVCIVSCVTLPQLLCLNYVQPIVTSNNVTNYVIQKTIRNANATFHYTYKMGVIVQNSFRIPQAIILLPFNIYFIILFQKSAKMSKIEKPKFSSSFTPTEKVLYGQKKRKFEKQQNAAVVNVCLSVQCCLYFLSEIMITIFLSMSIAGYSRTTTLMINIQSLSQMIKITTASLNFPFYYILSSEFRNSIQVLFKNILVTGTTQVQPITQ